MFDSNPIPVGKFALTLDKYFMKNVNANDVKCTGCSEYLKMDDFWITIFVDG